MYREDCFGADGTKCNITDYTNCVFCPFYTPRKVYVKRRLKYIEKERQFRKGKEPKFNETRFNNFVRALEAEVKK